VYLRDESRFGRIAKFVAVTKTDSGTSHEEIWALVHAYVDCRFHRESQCFLAQNELSDTLVPVHIDTLEEPLIFAIIDGDVWFINAQYERTFRPEEDL
jgi:hypothetical protein